MWQPRDSENKPPDPSWNQRTEAYYLFPEFNLLFKTFKKWTCFQPSVSIRVGLGFTLTSLPILFLRCSGRKQRVVTQNLAPFLVPMCRHQFAFQKRDAYKGSNPGCPGPRTWFTLWTFQHDAKLAAFGSRWLMRNKWRGDFKWKLSQFSLYVTSEVFPELVPHPPSSPTCFLGHSFSDYRPLKTVFAGWPNYESSPF